MSDTRKAPWTSSPEARSRGFYLDPPFRPDRDHSHARTSLVPMTKEDGPQPRPEAIKRLTFAYEQWWKVAEAEGEHVARLWFIGANPWLDNDTPVNAIREGRLKEVSHAAQALVDDAFSG